MGFKTGITKSYVSMIWVTVLATFLGTLGCCRAEGHTLTKRQVHTDYDEHFGFGLMAEDPVYPKSHSVMDGNISRGIPLDQTEPTEDLQDSRLSENDKIEYLGCYFAWKNFSRNASGKRMKYDDDFTHIKCSDRCMSKYSAQISLLRGAECICLDFDSFWLTKAPAKECSIPCPLSEYLAGDISKKAIDGLTANESCGGNTHFSVYCRSPFESEECNELIQRDLWKTAKVKEEVSVYASSESLSCAKCSASSCFQMISPSYDYFPLNSPKNCLEFCQYGESYLDIDTNTVLYRLPTNYSVLVWDNTEGTGNPRPICNCLDDISIYVSSETEDNCHTPCPGDRQAVCGKAFEKDTPTFASVYCNNPVACEAPLLIPFPDQDVSSSTTEEYPYTTEDTTTEYESTTEVDPSDPTPTITTEGTPSTTEGTPSTTEGTPSTTEDTQTTTEGTPTTDDTSSEYESTTEGDPSDPASTSTPEGTQTTDDTSSGYEPTPSVGDGSDPTSTTTEPWDNSTITTTPTTTTTSNSSLPPVVSSSTTTEIPQTVNCNKYCIDTEVTGNREWTVCQGSNATKDCGVANSTGRAVWRCLDNGTFETDQPDYTGCTSSWLEDSQASFPNVTDTETAITFLDLLKENMTSVAGEGTYFGHDMESIISILAKVVSVANSATMDSVKFEEVAEKVAEISMSLITTQDPWYQLGDKTRSSVSTSLLDQLEAASLTLTAKVNISAVENNGKTYKKVLASSTKNEYFVQVGVISKKTGWDDLDYASSSRDSFIRLPENWTSLVSGNKIEFIEMHLEPKFASLMMPGQYKSLGLEWADKVGRGDGRVKVINGKLMTLTLASDNGWTFGRLSHHFMRSLYATTDDDIDDRLSISFPGKGVEISFKHSIEAWGDKAMDIHRKRHSSEEPTAALGTASCVFWDTAKSTWSPRGCEIVSSTREITICSCNHLTSFALLMDTHDYVGKELGLEILTIVLCSLSFLCLLAAVLVFTVIQGVQSERTTITKNLSVCLLMGNTLILLVLDKHYFHTSKGVCIASGIFAHYVFLAAFSWMAIEGIHLYRMVVHVFDTERCPLNKYRLISYGIPAIIVAITCITGFIQDDEPYYGEDNCWLNGNYLWSFLFPIAVIILGNFIILLIALKTASQLKQNRSLSVTQGRVRSFKTWIRGCFSISVLLGITWIIGFFTLLPEGHGLVAAYLFTIFNASQGIFIFTFHCLLNDKIRRVTLHRLDPYLPAWITSSINSIGSESGGENQNKFGGRMESNMKNSSNSMNSSSLRDTPNKITINYEARGIPEMRAKLPIPNRNVVCMDETGGKHIQSGRQGSHKAIGIIAKKQRFNNGYPSKNASDLDDPNFEYLRGSTSSAGSLSDSGNTTDNSLRILIATPKRPAEC